MRTPLCGGNGSFWVILCRFCVNLAILGVLGGILALSQENSRDSIEIRCFRGFSVFSSVRLQFSGLSAGFGLFPRVFPQIWGKFAWWGERL